MKTMKFIAALIFAFTMTLSVSAKNNHQVYYQNGNNNQQYKVTYNLDNDGRIENKVIMVLNSAHEWCPVGAYSIFYGEDTTTLTYAAWNPKTHSFNLNAQQQEYNAKEYPVLMTLPSKTK